MDKTIEPRIVADDLELDVFVGNLVKPAEMKGQMKIEVVRANCGNTNQFDTTKTV